MRLSVFSVRLCLIKSSWLPGLRDYYRRKLLLIVFVFETWCIHTHAHTYTQTHTHTQTDSPPKKSDHLPFELAVCGTNDKILTSFLGPVLANYSSVFAQHCMLRAPSGLICSTLGAFAMLRKPTITFVMSVSLYVRPHAELGSSWTYFHEIWVLFETVEKIQVSLGSDKNNGHFTWRPTSIYDISLYCS
jgi:hypothetical protein